jgi:subtilisin family serine protease
MDARFAWGLNGGRGDNVKIIDIEQNWNLDHSDLAEAASALVVHESGFDPNPGENVNHGTAVLGEIVASDDGVGVTGIAPRSVVGLINPVSTAGSSNIAAAITRAASLLEAGDVILVEQQIIGPRFDFLTGRGLVPPELDPAVFDAIRAATARGIVVIEPAANGFDDLDHPVYRGAFDRNVRDSGAIIVGAGMPPEGEFGPGPDRSPTNETNFGSRIDLQGWGRSVATCGYGDLRRDRGENNWYTASFGGTSGAAAMVAGAAAIIQSILKAQDRAPLSPAQLRQLLVSTGSPQTNNLSRHIGPRPNLKAAIEALDSSSRLTPVINSAAYNESNGRLVIRGNNFIAGDSVIEVTGVRVPKMKYPGGAILPNGTTTKIMSKGDITGLAPRGVSVVVTVLNQSTGERSAGFEFRRE